MQSRPRSGSPVSSCRVAEGDHSSRELHPPCFALSRRDLMAQEQRDARSYEAVPGTRRSPADASKVSRATGEAARKTARFPSANQCRRIAANRGLRNALRAGLHGGLDLRPKRPVPGVWAVERTRSTPRFATSVNGFVRSSRAAFSYASIDDPRDRGNSTRMVQKPKRVEQLEMPQDEHAEVHRRWTAREIDEHVPAAIRLVADGKLVREVPHGHVRSSCRTPASDTRRPGGCRPDAV